MRRFTPLLLGVALGVATCVSAAPQTAVKAPGTQSYELKEFFADFTHFAIGDTVPEMYRTEEYNIKQWKQRNLPAPDAGTHWTYMGGNYVLITDAEGKILKVYDGEIFYHR
ncbi:RcnB family protein [Superficieibacter sp.]|uniref:RcnB family protein n=1 Tax=Superficieibacter sp. TaxID=2303322 RepID=UPI0028A658C6|nr:RcnB family protein [Superficieibacter sp.]